MYSTRRVIHREVGGRVLRREAQPKKGGEHSSVPRARKGLTENDLKPDQFELGQRFIRPFAAIVVKSPVPGTTRGGSATLKSRPSISGYFFLRHPINEGVEVLVGKVRADFLEPATDVSADRISQGGFIGIFFVRCRFALIICSHSLTSALQLCVTAQSGPHFLHCQYFATPVHQEAYEALSFITRSSSFGESIITFYWVPNNWLPNISWFAPCFAGA